MKTIQFITILILMSYNLFGQIDNAKIDKLKEFDLHPFPILSDLKNISLDDKWINVKQINIQDVDSEFNNISDLSWIKEISQQNKVIMLGENHYYKYIQHFRNRLLFALNTYDYYPLIVLENQYSLTEFFNYYLELEDEQKANEYFNNVINEMVHTQETQDLLKHIKRWNKKYPNKTVRIGFHDIEHDFKTTIRNIILPYFNKINNEITIDYELLTHHDLDTLIPQFRKILIQSKKQNLIGDYPFITPQYIKTVIDNLESLYLAYNFDHLNFRQKAMVRNLTDDQFLGRYWLNEKVFIHGGYRHLPTHFKFPDNLNFYREGSYLTYDFALTKGKTYSIQVIGIARSLGAMAEIDLKDCLHVGGGYKWSFNKYQNAYKKDLIQSDEFLFEWKINSFDSLIVKKALQNNSIGVMIETAEWSEIMEKTKYIDKGQYKNLKYVKSDYLNYDKHIYFIKSPFTVARKKPNE